MLNENTEGWQWLRRVCGIPKSLRDLEDVTTWSEAVYDTYGEFERVYKWGKPRLQCTTEIDQLCLKGRAWPTELQRIMPERASTTGNWWLYRGFREDGIPLPSSIPNIWHLYLPGND